MAHTNQFFHITGTALDEVLDSFHESGQLNPAAFTRIAETACLMIAHDFGDLELTTIFIDRAARWEATIKGRNFPKAGSIFGKFTETANISYLTGSEAGESLIMAHALRLQGKLSDVGHELDLAREDILDLAIFAYLVALTASNPQQDWVEVIDLAAHSIELKLGILQQPVSLAH